MKAIYRIGIQKIVAPEHDIRVIAASFLDKGGVSEPLAGIIHI